LIFSIPPDSTEYRYKTIAAMMTSRIGHKAKRTPSNAANPIEDGVLFITKAEIAAAKTRPTGHAMCPGCRRTHRETKSQRIGIMENIGTIQLLIEKILT
jgi:hypothetical protein